MSSALARPARLFVPRHLWVRTSGLHVRAAAVGAHTWTTLGAGSLVACSVASAADSVAAAASRSGSPSSCLNRADKVVQSAADAFLAAAVLLQLLNELQERLDRPAVHRVDGPAAAPVHEHRRSLSYDGVTEPVEGDPRVRRMPQEKFANLSVEDSQQV